MVLDGLRDNRFGAPGVYSVHRCTHCGAEQTLPRPTSAEPRTFDARDDNIAADASGKAGGARYARFREWLFRSWIYRLWLRLDGDASFHLVRGRGRLLDCGCNEGRGLERYRANGFTAEGWELNRQAAAQARARGFTVHTEELVQFQPDALYDVIVLSDALGYSRDPRATLRDLGRILAPGGELWISLPNAASLFREVFGCDWINWHAPYRVMHFAPSVLRRLLADEGFLVRRLACVTPALWLTQSALVRLYGRPGKPTGRPRKPVLLAGWMLTLRGFFFPTLFFLNRALRGDCLIVRARKRGA